MPLFRDEALVLRTWDLAESDRIVSLFGRSRGKVRVVAKGAKKLKSRFAGRLEPLHKVDVTYYGKEGAVLLNLSSIEISRAFDKATKDLGRFYAASYLSEMVETGIKENDANPKAFGIVLRTLEWLEEEKADLGWLVRVFDVRFLSALGYRPALASCVGCGKPWTGQTEPIFDAEAGGLKCTRCAGKSAGQLLLSKGSAQFLAKMLEGDFEKTRRLKPSIALLGEITRAIKAFRNARLQTVLKTEKYLDTD